MPTLETMASIGLINGRFWTANRAHPHAAALRMEGSTIESVDDESSARSAEYVIDLHGRFVSPGLIDAHTHLVMAGESLGRLDLSQVKSRAEFEAAIASRSRSMHAAHGSEGREDRDRPEAEACPTTEPCDTSAWLIAHGWHNENWGGELPDKSWLRAAGERPCVAYRMDSHACIINDAVLAMLDSSLGDPDGGRIVRDDQGRPTGLFFEAAAWELINPIMPSPRISHKRRAVLAAQKQAHEFGLTTMGSMEYERTVRDVLKPLRYDMTLRIRVTLLDRELPLDFAFAESFENDDSLAIIGYKAFLDGTLGSRTAKLLADYSDDPGNAGLWLEHASRGDLQKWCDDVCDHGFQPAMHAIGDAAARLALETIEAHHPSGHGDVCHRIEHAQQVDPADIKRFAGIIASMQPLHRADDGRFALNRVGSERMSGFFALRSLMNAGATLAFGSDWPIVSCDPMLGIRASVTGLTTDGELMRPEETIDVEDALHAYTIGAAKALRFDGRAGSLSRGKLADIAMWDVDPFECDWIRDSPRIVTTIVGGDTVFEREAISD